MRNLLKAAILGLIMAASLSSTAAGATEVTGPESGGTWKSVPTQTITAGGVDFAYRELGKSNGGTPAVFLVHLGAVLAN